MTTTRFDLEAGCSLLVTAAVVARTFGHTKIREEEEPKNSLTPIVLRMSL